MNKFYDIVISLMIIILIVSVVLMLYKEIVMPNSKEIPIIIEKDGNIPHTYMGEFEITFYTHTGNNTSTGVYPRANRTIAVDPEIIPYGTAIYVEGYGVFFAEDSGADIKGHRLDIFLDDKKEALQNGRPKANVYILEAK